MKQGTTSLRIPGNEFAVIRKLNRKHVAYLLIGGYAIHFYGWRRPTTDVDLLIHNSPENARQLFIIIRDLYNEVPPDPPCTESDLTKPCQRLDLRGCGYVLDILTSVDGLDFATAYRAQEVALQRGITIPVAAKEDLLFIKRIAAASDESRREKELRDIAFLESLGTCSKG